MSAPLATPLDPLPPAEQRLGDVILRAARRREAEGVAIWAARSECVNRARASLTEAAAEGDAGASVDLGAVVAALLEIWESGEVKGADHASIALLSANHRDREVAQRWCAAREDNQQAAIRLGPDAHAGGDKSESVPGPANNPDGPREAFLHSAAGNFAQRSH